MNEKILCTKDVVMENGVIAFTKGKIYKANLKLIYMRAENNEGKEYGLGTINDEDRWFQNYFEIVE